MFDTHNNDCEGYIVFEIPINHKPKDRTIRNLIKFAKKYVV